MDTSALRYIPNGITTLRLILVLPITFSIVEENHITAFLLFAISGFSDGLDGFIARRYGWVSAFGELIDPLADKLLIMAALLSLVQMELAPAWMVAIILGRELGVTVLRSIAFSRGVTMSASPLGKVKMMSQVIAILLLILGEEYLQQFFILGQIALWVVVVTALISAADYYRRFTQVGSNQQVTNFESARRRTTEKKPPGAEPAPDDQRRRVASRM